MEWSTTILTLILIGAATSALFVFVSAARLYVSPSDEADSSLALVQLERRSTGSSGRYGDRRKSDGKVEFPLRLGNIVIEQDRRHTPDRRQGLIH